MSFSTAGGFSPTLGALGAASGFMSFSTAGGFSFFSVSGFAPGGGGDSAALPAALAGTAPLPSNSPERGIAAIGGLP